jgi:DNA-binding transcriptional MerR regulator
VLIGEVRRATGLTNRAIRFYEEKGLVLARRDRTGQRCYDRDTVNRLIYVALARKAGLTITQISDLLTLGDAQGEAALSARTQEIYRSRLADINSQREALEAIAETMGFAPSRLQAAPAEARSHAR